LVAGKPPQMISVGEASRPLGATPLGARPTTCLIICGPTGSGKTRLAVALSNELDLLAISADSRQIYRRFDIGTAKPTMEERRRLPHACLDLTEPTMRFTAYAWAEAADRAADDARRIGRTPLIVGGAGFYIRAFAHPVTAVAPQGIERVRAHYLLVDPGPILRHRIAQRATAMASEGWPEEVAALARDVPPDAPAWQSCGYAAMREYVGGAISLPAALERVTTATRRYAKRQRTWFRHQLPASRVTHLNPDDPGALQRAMAWIRGADPHPDRHR
jgi:tRNA dimethylallyltransferase